MNIYFFTFTLSLQRKRMRTNPVPVLHNDNGMSSISTYINLIKTYFTRFMVWFMCTWVYSCQINAFSKCINTRECHLTDIMETTVCKTLFVRCLDKQDWELRNMTCMNFDRNTQGTGVGPGYCDRKL